MVVDMANLSITLDLDASAYRSAISEFCEAIDPLDLPADLCHAIGKVGLHLAENGRAVKMHAVAAAGAKEMTVFLEPSDCFLSLLAAARACNRKYRVVGGGHG